MSDPYVRLRASTARRIIAGIRKIEQPTPVVATASPRSKLPPAGLRAFLAQPLNGQGSALAVVARRQTAHPLIDVSILPIPLSNHDSAFEFELVYGVSPALVSHPISVSATAEELATALEPWNLPADSYHVLGGEVALDDIPSGLPRPDTDLHLRRWVIAFDGPQWDTEDPQPIVTRQPLARVSGIAYTSHTEWEPTGDIILVREPGLMSSSYGSQFARNGQRYSLGTAILCDYLADAEAYVIKNAEHRWFEDFQGLWRAWINQHQWAKFVRHPADVQAYQTNITRIKFETDVEEGWLQSGYNNLVGVGFGGFPGYGWGYWGLSGWFGNYGWGPYNSRPVKVRSSGTLPAPLLPDTVYYIRDYDYHDKSLALSETSSGPPIVLTDDGTGEHEILLYGDPEELI